MGNQYSKQSLMERFQNKVSYEPNSGCWLWTGGVTGTGYGIIRNAHGKTQTAHRVSWELHNGPIPKNGGYHGTCVCHKCDTPACVNPAHLFLGSNAENVKDMMEKGRGARVGSEHGRAKLTEAQVEYIKRFLGLGMKQKDIADLYPVSRVNTSLINTGRIWKHVIV